jgi:hypothetical protein
VFHEARAPSIDELKFTQPIIQRVLKLLTRTGYLIEEQGMTYLAQAESDRAPTPLHMAAWSTRKDRRRLPTRHLNIGSPAAGNR